MLSIAVITIVCCLISRSGLCLALSGCRLSERFLASLCGLRSTPPRLRVQQRVVIMVTPTEAGAEAVAHRASCPWYLILPVCASVVFAFWGKLLLRFARRRSQPCQHACSMAELSSPAMHVSVNNTFAIRCAAGGRVLPRYRTRAPRSYRGAAPAHPPRSSPCLIAPGGQPPRPRVYPASRPSTLPATSSTQPRAGISFPISSQQVRAPPPGPPLASSLHPVPTGQHQPQSQTRSAHTPHRVALLRRATQRTAPPSP